MALPALHEAKVPQEARSMIISKPYEERRLKLLAGMCQGSSVLDLGYAHYPNPYFEDVHRVGLDLTKPKQRSDYEEELVGDARDAAEALGGRTFDTIVCGELIEHIENPYALLRSLRDSLADDGLLLLSTPNPMAFPVVFAEMLRSSKYFYTRDHLYYFLPRWVERLLTATGYETEDVKPVGLWTPWFVGPAPVALSYQVIYAARKAGV